MNPLDEQLARAYREQQRIYEEIKDLVNEQIRIMEERQDPRAVLGLCRDVEQRMNEISVIEEAIKPAKRRWEESGARVTGELESALSFVQAAIDEIVVGQARVQEHLLQCVQQHRDSTENARRSVRLSRARSLYRAG